MLLSWLKGFIKLSSSKKVVAINEECQPKEKNKEVHHSKKLQKQLLYVEELQQQILDGKIKAEQELEHDQAVINQQTRESELFSVNCFPLFTSFQFGLYTLHYW